MAPPGDQPSNRFSGNCALYLFQALVRQRVFLPRNINAVLEANGSGEDGEERRSPRPRKRASLATVLDRLQKRSRSNNQQPGTEGAVLKFEARGLKLSGGTTGLAGRNHRTTHGGSRTLTPFRCLCEVRIRLEDGPRPREIYRKTGVCTVTPRTDGRAQVTMERPIVIHRRDICIFQKHGNTERFVLGETYTAAFQLFPENPSTPWPPLVPGIPLSGFQLERALTATIPDLFTEPTTTWYVLKQHDPSTTNITDTPLHLDLHISWTRPKPQPSNPTHLTIYTPSPRFTQESFPLPGHACLFCNSRPFPSPSTLHFHLLTAHDYFSYRLRAVKPPATHESATEITFSIPPHATHTPGSSDPDKFLWLAPPQRFSLPALLRGDWSWTAARALPRTLPAPAPSRLPLHNVPAITTRPRRLCRAPLTAHLDPPVLLRSRSKRFVYPHEELSESDDDPDESWLQLRTEQMLDDFEDVAPAEKRFMKLWNAHLFREKPCAGVYIPQVLVRFVTQHRERILAEGLGVECWKHALNLVMWGLLGGEGVRRVMEILRGDGAEEVVARGDFIGGVEGAGADGREKKRIKTEGGEGAEKWRGVCRKSCTRPWVRTEMVRCDGKECDVRWFHKACFGVTAKRPAMWVCPRCRELEEEGVMQ